MWLTSNFFGSPNPKIHHWFCHSITMMVFDAHTQKIENLLRTLRLTIIKMMCGTTPDMLKNIVCSTIKVTLNISNAWPWISFWFFFHCIKDLIYKTWTIFHTCATFLNYFNSPFWNWIWIFLCNFNLSSFSYLKDWLTESEPKFWFMHVFTTFFNSLLMIWWK